MLQNFTQLHIQWAVNDEAQRALIIVFADVGDRVKEIGIFETRHGNQEMVGQVS